jgi:hypothetical protein
MLTVFAMFTNIRNEWQEQEQPQKFFIVKLKGVNHFFEF